MRVALLSADHVQPYRVLMLEAYALSPDAFTSTAEERAAEPDSWWARRLADPSGLTAAFGAFSGEELVGTVALEFSNKPKTRHKGQLIGMYVKPQARGTGVGRLLVQAALSYAAARPGVEVLTLTVTQGNVPAESLYSSLGFKLFGVEPMALRVASGYLAKVHMWALLRGGAETAA
ncbi:MAG: GNAT family N-acetyltransferase [Burkholderiales bacterium]|nr:GNAT family N-acetyltransferase [Burkholderiales bacterium]